MERTTPPAGPGRRRAATRRRRLKRALLVFGTFLVVLALTTLWGWRHGFTRLPGPVAEVSLPEVVVVVDWDSSPPDSAWAAIREYAQTPEVARWNTDEEWFRPEFLMVVLGHSRGHSASNITEYFGERLGSKGGQIFDEFLQFTHRPPVRGLPERADCALRMLGLVPLVRAAAARTDPGNASQLEAVLRHLITGFAFHARLTPPAEFAGVFDERGMREVDATLGRTFRRLVLEGPALEPSAGRALLEDLRRVTNDVIPFETAYALRVQQARERRDANHRRITSGVGPALGLRAGLLWDDVLGLPHGLFLWWGGVEPRPGFFRNAHLRGMLGILADWGQEKLARERDFECIWRFRLSHLLASPWDPEPARPRLREDAWFNWLDRPAVWDSTGEMPSPATVLKELGEFLATVELCRLTLALRLYRDREGDWPDSLGQLVPDLLSGVPADPLSRGAVDYRREGTGWRLAAGYATGDGLSCTSSP